MLRIQIRISQKRASLISSTDTSQAVDQLSPPPRMRKRSNRTLRMATHSQSIASLYVPESEDVSSLIMGPLVSGLRTFEARYLGLLSLNHKFHRCKYYARRWSALRAQPAEVVLVRNPTTKKMEIRSPRLPWPVNYLMGSSALDFELPTSPRIKQFTSAVLYLTILSACGLRSLHLTRMLNKCRPRQQLGTPAEHRGVVAAEMMAYSQSLARSTERFSTYVQLQFGKDRYATKTQKFTYDPIWNQTFCFAITNSSPFLVDVQLYNIANPNITGPASGIEKLAETLIDISHLPLDITQRMEVELSGPHSRPRLLFLATLTGLSTTPNRHIASSASMCQGSEIGTISRASSKYDSLGLSKALPTAGPQSSLEGCSPSSPNSPSVPSEFCDPVLLHSVDSQLADHYTQKFTYDPIWNQTFCFAITNSSPFLVDVQLYNIANPNITGPASGIEKLAETLIDISHLPLDITQRMEVELSGPHSRPRLLFLATLTGLSTTPNRHIASSASMCQGSEIGTISRASSKYDSLGLSKALPTAGPQSSLEGCSPSSPNSPSVPSEFCDPVLLHSVDSQLADHYSWRNSLSNRYDVGFLRVRVIAAADLEAKDLNGKSDPYCVLDLLNMRVQTQTIEKTCSPRWNKTFIFPVTDIHAVLSIRVMDQDKNKSDFLGRLAIPLLWIKNNKQSWYALKDANLRGRARGSLLLEFFFVYNHFKAAWRSLQPPEETVLDGDKKCRVSKLHPNYRLALQEHIARLKTLFGGLSVVGKLIQDLCSWENPLQTTAVLVGYIVAVWNFQPFMVPLGMIAGILANRYLSGTHHLLSVCDSLRAAYGVGASNLLDGRFPPSLLQGPTDEQESANGGIVIRNDLLDAIHPEITITEDVTDQVAKEEKSRDKDAKQGKNRFAAIMDVMDDLPDILDMVASSFERINGLFNWNVPWITWLVLFLLLVATLVLYFVPFRVILIIIGANLLTKRIIRPAHHSTFELFNVISRIPSNPELEQRRQFPPSAFVYPS
ncbi:Multiple C2 and transmembrane domain-containing protein 2 [Sparganum proliferum]